MQIDRWMDDDYKNGQMNGWMRKKGCMNGWMEKRKWMYEWM